MKIAYLINQYPAPSQTFIRREIAALESLGWEVARFTLRPWNGPTVDPADELELRRTRAVLKVGPFGLLLALLVTLAARPLKFVPALLMAFRMGRRSERGIVVNLIYLAEACVLRRWLAQSAAKHLHAHFGTNSAAVALLCFMIGGPPFSFTVHGPDEFDSPRALSLGEKVRGAAFVVAISEFTRSQLCRWADPDDWSKIKVIRCGLDASYLKPGPLPPIRQDCRRFVCVGRLAEQKGQLVLIEAAAILAAQGRDFEIALIGDGPMRAQIEQQIERSGLSNRVHLLGWRDGASVREEILRARAMILPSFAEGLPVVLMEALALGRPVISTYIAGIPELIEPGVNGWLVPAGSVEGLLGAMAEALDSQADILTTMGTHGMAGVSARHNVKNEAHKLLKLVQ